MNPGGCTRSRLFDRPNHPPLSPCPVSTMPRARTGRFGRLCCRQNQWHRICSHQEPLTGKALTNPLRRPHRNQSTITHGSSWWKGQSGRIAYRVFFRPGLWRNLYFAQPRARKSSVVWNWPVSSGHTSPKPGGGSTHRSGVVHEEISGIGSLLPGIWRPLRLFFRR